MSTTITTWLLQLRDRITAPLRNVRGEADQAGDAVERANERAASFGNTLKRVAVAFASVAALTGTIKAAAEVEQTNVAFEVLLGNAEKGKKMAEGLTAFANATPYVTENLQSAAKTMLSFGLSAEDVMPNLKAIGNIAMGDANKLNSLSLAFSQASSTGKLMGQDLMQMINAGFNPLEEMSRKTGKSIAVLKDEMSKGLISAKLLRDAFLSAAGAGGRFGGMMERMAASTKGKWSTLTGQIKQVGVEIGTKLLPIVNVLIDKALKFASFLQRHASTILKIAAGVGVLVGVIKAVNIATALWTARLTILNSVLALNPIMAVIGLVAGLTTAIYSFNKASTTATKVQEGFIKSLMSARSEMDKDFLALKKTKEGTDERRRAIEDINTKYGDYLGNLLTEKSTLEDITDAQNRATIALAKNIALKTQQEKITTVISEAQEKVEEAYNKIVDEIAKKKGNSIAGYAAKDLHKVFNSVQNDPEVFSGEGDFARKYGMETYWMLKQMNLVRGAYRKSNYEQYKINRFFDSYLSGFNLNAVTSTIDETTGGNGGGGTGGNGNGTGDGLQLSGTGGGRGGITMNITMNNTFKVANDLDVKSIAEMIFKQVNDRLRDGLTTAGG